MFLLYQTAFGKVVLEGQLSKLGILPPEGVFWPALKNSFNTMWANNGDVLSRQYAGTNALKVNFDLATSHLLTNKHCVVTV